MCTRRVKIVLCTHELNSKIWVASILSFNFKSQFILIKSRFLELPKNSTSKTNSLAIRIIKDYIFSDTKGQRVESHSASKTMFQWLERYLCTDGPRIYISNKHSISLKRTNMWIADRSVDEEHNISATSRFECLSVLCTADARDLDCFLPHELASLILWSYRCSN